MEAEDGTLETGTQKRQEIVLFFITITNIKIDKGYFIKYFASALSLLNTAVEEDAP